jgi:O-antigen biosynthesis protein
MKTATSKLLRDVKGRLLPLSPLAEFLERTVEALPRKIVNIELRPANDIAVLDEAKGEYKSTGYFPRFQMVIESELANGGWYYLETALVRNNGNREARIYGRQSGVTPGDFNILIPTNLRGSVREVFYLPRALSALYWSPTAAPGFFTQSELLIHKITVLEGVLRRLHRVLIDLWRFRNKSSDSRAGLTWRGAIANLQDAYSRTADLRMRRLSGNDYAAFIEINDTFKKSDIDTLRKNVSDMKLCPLITMIMPVRNPTPGCIKSKLEAIIQQIYPNWELLLVGDLSSVPESLVIAQEHEEKDSRIRVVLTQADAGITVAYNKALESAQGEYLARIEQDDTIPAHALYCLACRINQEPNLEFIYTDHDEMDKSGKRTNPCFKPDWNPDLFTSYNYLGGLCLYRTVNVLALHGYRRGFEGAEEYDLALRYLKRTPALKIQHIPRVLYHRSQEDRIEPKVTRMTHHAGKRALEDHFFNSGVAIEDGPINGLYQVRHPLPSPLPLVSIIVPTRDRVDFLKACIDSIQQKTDYQNWELLIIDNQSKEMATFSYLEQLKCDTRIKVIWYDKPFNYSAMNNYAVQFASGEIVALLNNDVEVISTNWLSEMVSHATRPGIGAVGAKLLYSSGLVQHCGVIIGLGGVAGHAHKYLKENDHGYCCRAVVTQNISAVTGACLVVRKNVYLDVGGLNETDLVVAFNDIDFCLRLNREGYRNVFTPHAKLYHHESISRGHDDTPEKQVLFLKEFCYMKRTWQDRLKHDPAYNPNLTLEFEDFSLSHAHVNIGLV